MGPEVWRCRSRLSTVASAGWAADENPYPRREDSSDRERIATLEILLRWHIVRQRALGDHHHVAIPPYD